MAEVENKTDEKVNEETEKVEISQDIQATEKEFDQNVAGMTSDAKKETKEERNTIENILRKADDKVEAKKLEMFLKELNGRLKEQGNEKEITSYADLTVEQREEYRNYKLPEEVENSLYEETKNEIFDVTKKRNEKLDELGKKLDEFYQVMQNKLEEKQKELANAKPEETSKIQSDIEKLNELIQKLGPNKEATSPIRKDLANAITNHDEARMNAANGLAIVFSEDRVHNDKDITENLIPSNKREQYRKEYEEKQAQKKGDEQQIEENAQNQIQGQQVRNQQGGQKIMYAGGQVAGENINGQQEPSQQGNSVGTQEVEQVEEDKFARFGDVTPAQEALTWIGYDATKPMSVKSAKALLKNFAREESKQMDILKDPKAAKVIFNAMNKVDKAKFFQKIGFGKTKKALLKAANEFLPKAAAQEYLGIRVKKGEELKEYDNIMNEYSKELKVLEDKKEKEGVTPELKEEFEKLEKKYAPVLAVLDYREKTNQYLNKDKNILPEAKEDIKEEDKFKDFSEEEKAKINELQEKINNMSYRDLNRMVLDLKEKGDKTTLSYINSGLIDLNGGQQKHFEAGMDGKKTDRTLLEHIKDASAEVEKEKEDKKNEFISTLTEKTENSAEKEADILEKINKNKISVEEYKKLPPDLQKKVKNNIQKSISEGELSKGEREVSEYINYEDTKEWAKTQENRNKDDKGFSK